MSRLVCSRCGREVSLAENWCWTCGTLNPPIEVEEDTYDEVGRG